MKDLEEAVSRFKETEERLERREKIALNLADQLNEKIDECEKLKEEVKWYVERVVTLEKQLHEVA